MYPHYLTTVVLSECRRVRYGKEVGGDLLIEIRSVNRRRSSSLRRARPVARRPAMKLSIDSKIEGSEGVADWVEAWSDDYGLTPQIDACLLGGGMYPGYEQYWSGIHDKPETPAWITGEPPTKERVSSPDGQVSGMAGSEQGCGTCVACRHPT